MKLNLRDLTEPGPGVDMYVWFMYVVVEEHPLAVLIQEDLDFRFRCFEGVFRTDDVCMNE